MKMKRNPRIRGMGFAACTDERDEPNDITDRVTIGLKSRFFRSYRRYNARETAGASACRLNNRYHG
jgi:hypothetical protein